jgi:maltose alpha-D-glucosyltransferase/alpha-amylase
VAYRPELLSTLKKIYIKKMDAQKIRIHGNYHLGQILLTGKDLAINDFSGDPSMSYSESRLRRSTFVDIASMVLSFYEVAFDGLWQDAQLHPEDVRRLLPMAGFWAYYNSGFFIGAYKEKMQGSPVIPALPEDFETMLQYYLVQKAMTLFNTYLKKDPKRVVIPQTILRKVLNPQTEPAAVAGAEAVAPVAVQAATVAPVGIVPEAKPSTRLPH